MGFSFNYILMTWIPVTTLIPLTIEFCVETWISALLLWILGQFTAFNPFDACNFIQIHYKLESSCILFEFLIPRIISISFVMNLVQKYKKKKQKNYRFKWQHHGFEIKRMAWIEYNFQIESILNWINSIFNQF